MSTYVSQRIAAYSTFFLMTLNSYHKVNTYKSYAFTTKLNNFCEKSKIRNVQFSNYQLT